MSTSAAGLEPGQRRLNGPQTTGRNFRNLSEAQYAMACDEDVAVPMRDGARLLVDVHRPDSDGRFPALVAASPYPRQIQDLGAPMGFIEAGATDFWVPRGYVHVIANLRGTGGSEGTFGFFDGQERLDMHDLVEWVAAQPWCNGNVGMIGISYFAMTQLEAAVERPPHLKAIFPVAVSADLFDAAVHNGLVSSSFVTPFLAMVGMTSARGDKLWRGKLLDAARAVLHDPKLHARFATFNGEAAMTGLKVLLKLHHDPHTWGDLWRDVVVEHQTRDAWWDERNLLPLLPQVDIPVYLGCDWDNVPLHLPSTFDALRALTNSPHVRVALLGAHGLAWPWESLHVEALAWFDHWLKGHDTGILDGPPIRYVLPGAEGWNAVDAWPPANATHRPFALRADGVLGDGVLGDGVLGEDEGEAGSREYLTLGAGLGRERRSEGDPPPTLTWTAEPLEQDLDLVGHAELRLDATSTAMDTAWIAILQDVDPSGEVTNVTAAYLRASLREVDEAASESGRPEHPCRTAQAVPIWEQVRYRLGFVANARRFKASHRIRLVLSSDDQDQATPAMLNFRHANVGTSSVNTIASSSLLLVPVVEPSPAS